MIDQSQKQQTIDKILKSSEFLHSAKHKKLLLYLFDAFTKNKTPKETDIAIALFDRDADFDPAADTIVRVSIHNLRSKLERYYETEGKRDKIRIALAKGHYKIQFFTYNQGVHTCIRNKLLAGKITIYTIICLLFLALFFKLIQYRNEIDFNVLELRNTKFWADMLNSNRDKLLVIGDEFFFIEYAGDDQQIIRRHDINSIDDLNNYIITRPDSLYHRKTPYSFFPKISIWPLRKIMNLFKPKDLIQFREASKLQSSELLKNDIIFIGTIRSLFLFNEIIAEAPYKLHWESNLTNQFITNRDSSLILPIQGGPNRVFLDYSFIKKIPGPSGNTILMIFSCFEAGMTGVMDIIANAEELSYLEQAIVDSLGSSARYYHLQFKTQGHNRTALKTEILQIRLYKENNNLW